MILRCLLCTTIIVISSFSSLVSSQNFRRAPLFDIKQSPVVGQIDVDIADSAIKEWPSKWWGCDSQVDNNNDDDEDDNDDDYESNDGADLDDDLFLSIQIENLAPVAHLALRVELLSVDEPASNAFGPVWTRAYLRVVEIFKINDLRGLFISLYITHIIVANCCGLLNNIQTTRTQGKLRVIFYFTLFQTLDLKQQRNSLLF